MSKNGIAIIADTPLFVAVNKPSGLLSIPDREGKEPSLKVLLEQQYGKIFTVHRIDRDTSGAIVFAKDAATHKQLSQMFEGRAVEKEYVGLLNGRLYPESGTVDIPLAEHSVLKGKIITHARGKASITDYRLLEAFRFHSWASFRIHTGRTHQIRVHMQHLGHPLVCDPLYGDGAPVFVSQLKKKYNLSKAEESERPILSRLALHSQLLRFTLNGETYTIEAELPKDLRATLQQLRKNS
jgi:23S rRNA pseudouridine1911/1915/1917 synthase